MELTEEELADIREDARFTSTRVGAPGCKVRVRAENTLRLLEEHTKLKALVRRKQELLELGL